MCFLRLLCWPQRYSHTCTMNTYITDRFITVICTTDTCTTGHLYNWTIVQQKVAQWTHVKPDSYTTGHLYNGQLKTDICTLGCLYKRTMSDCKYGHKCLVVQMFVFQFCGRSIIRFQMSVIQMPTCTKDFVQTSLVQVPIVHMALYNCSLYKWPLYSILRPNQHLKHMWYH